MMKLGVVKTDLKIIPWDVPPKRLFFRGKDSSPFLTITFGDTPKMEMTPGVDLDDAARQFLNICARLLGQPPMFPETECRSEALEKAVHNLLEWDARRGYPIPYRVRDPILDALTRGSAV